MARQVNKNIPLRLDNLITWNIRAGIEILRGMQLGDWLNTPVEIPSRVILGQEDAQQGEQVKES